MGVFTNFATSMEAQIFAEMEKLRDAGYLSRMLRHYPREARPLVGIPLGTLAEVARTLARQADWEKVVTDLMGRGRYEDVVLAVNILDNTTMNDSDFLRRLADYVPEIDSRQLCDAICLSAHRALNHPEMMHRFLAPYLAGPTDLQQRFALVMILDYFVNIDSIADTLETLSHVRPVGPESEDALAWAYQVSFLAFPRKTCISLERLGGDDRLFELIVTRIERCNRLLIPDRMMLQRLRYEHQQTGHRPVHDDRQIWR